MEENENKEEKQNNRSEKDKFTQTNNNKLEQNLSSIEAVFHAIDKISENVKNFVDKKYKHDYTGQIIYGLIVLIILSAIIILALYDKITETAIGTLLGTTIGYAIGKFSQNKSGSNKE